MSMTHYEIKEILEEAEPRIVGRTVLAFRDGIAGTYLLILEAPTGGFPRILRLLISVQPGLDRIHLTPRPSPDRKKLPPTPFAARIHELLEGARLTALELAGRDRVVKIDFSMEDGRKHTLMAELIGRHANLLLLDEDGIIRDLVRPYLGKQRSLQRDAPYPPLPPPRKKVQKAGKLSFGGVEGAPWEEAPLSGAADAHFLDLERKEEERRLRRKCLKNAARRLKRDRGLLARLKQELAKAEHADRYKKQGDLLQANFALLRKGQTEIEVVDLFSVDAERTVIPLNPAKGPVENIDACYRRYKKQKSSIAHLEERIRTLEAGLPRLDALVTALPAMDSLEALADAAAALGVKAVDREARRKSEVKEAVREARVFRSSDGLKLLVGRDGPSNDRLTFHLARGNDMWLHCRGTAGSHVVIRGERNKPIPLNSLIDAGLLAVHFSRLRGADKAEVAYTQRKYIRRIRGGPPGKVTLERFKTLLIQSDPERLKRILDSAGPKNAASGDDS